MSLVTVALRFVTDAALGVWLGSVVFFSFVAAPTVFDVLAEDRAGSVVNAVFPKYYVFGIGLGVLAAAGAAARVVLDAPFTAALAALFVLVAAGVALDAYARWVLIPKMEAAGEDAFERYHGRSVVLNGVTLLAVAGALLAAQF